MSNLFLFLVLIWLSGPVRNPSASRLHGGSKPSHGYSVSWWGQLKVWFRYNMNVCQNRG